ncbi:DUF6702 family protein [Confluentibacter flavum]|uniref:Peptidase E n=1 Tax=Confluentibacter flavum TaxID=1909700 RepID=A0A2N3HG97_9FLAO|nr:DUF6702 family protein [Confluentibacter flavum]PKQ43924.1 peptidase E [Confluentibacter flavum]
MKFIKISILLVVLCVSAFTAVHKFYLSVTQIEYVQDKQSVQIISRIFMDDFENLLRERYDKTINLDDDKKAPIVDDYIQKYLAERIKIKINGKDVNFNFIGKDTDLDVMKVYLEIEGIKEIHSFQITNKVLFDLFDEQQNMVKLKINALFKNYLLTSQNDNAVLNFD